MIIRYEYNSTCCNHLYMETRTEDVGQVVTQCNVCGQGEYTLSNEVILEEEPEQLVVEEETEITDSLQQGE